MTTNPVQTKIELTLQELRNCLRDMNNAAELACEASHAAQEPGANGNAAMKIVQSYLEGLAGCLNAASNNFADVKALRSTKKGRKNA